MSHRALLPRMLLLTLGLGLAGPASAEDDELRAQRATRRVLKEQEQREEISEAARRLARERRLQAMAMLRPLIEDAEGERKAEMILRLGELTAAEADHLRALAFERWEVCLARDDEACGAGPEDLPEARALLDASLARRAEALDLYEHVRGYPHFARMDEAAWGQAWALMELGRPEEAQRALIQLVRGDPESPRAASAYVLIGDHHFDQDRALPALNAYRRAAAYIESEIRPYALYKQAWCLFNLGEHEQAIAMMRAVALEQGGGVVTLQDEALRDLARFYADAGDLDGALRFYRGLNRPDLLRQAMTRIVSHAEQQGHASWATQALGLLIAELPRDPEAPGWQARIVRIQHASGRADATLDELERLLRDYGPGSAWARASASDADALRAAHDSCERTLRDVAVDWHQLARKLGSGAEAEAAAGRALAAYQAWLERFDDEPHAHELRYAYAELLYRVGRHEQAFTQYREVVARDPEGPRSLFCAESAVYVADAMVGEPAGHAPPGLEPLPLSLWDERLVASVDRFLSMQPEGERSLAFATKAAWLLYHRNRFAEAADRFEVVIAMDPGSEEAEIAANLILDSLNLIGDYVTLAETAEAFLRQGDLGRPGFHAQLEGVQHRARFRIIERALELDGDRGAAAVAFEAYAARFPRSEVAALALHNAAVHHRAASEPHGAIRAAIELVEGYPASEYALDALAGLGFDHESIADFERAALWYERLAHEAPEHDAAPDALWSAALFRIALEQDEAARRNLRLHAHRWPHHQRQGEVLAELAGLHEAALRHAEAAAVWARIPDLAQEQASEGLRAHAMLRQGRALQALDRDEEAAAVWAAVRERWGGAELASSPELRESVAEAWYRLGVESLQRYEAIDLSGHGAPSGRAAAEAWSRRQVTTKAQALREVEEAHAAVIAVGDGGWGLAALVRLGGAYEHMAGSLREAWVPHWLTPEQVELYRLALDDEAWMQEEKAVEAYRGAVERSRALALYGEALDQAGIRLSALRPDEVPTPSEDLLRPGYLADPGGPPPFVTEP